ncbi:hypothetical protein C6499_10295 [Candidatus Poribacteria bacterium]|nr:MAG: hypothetical protein C6499_10295 [Candidatus Poribacteria bacterium]
MPIVSKQRQRHCLALTAMHAKKPSIVRNLNTLGIYTLRSEVANYVGVLNARGLICTKMGSPYFKVDNMGHSERAGLKFFI